MIEAIVKTTERTEVQTIERKKRYSFILFFSIIFGKDSRVFVLRVYNT